MIIYQITNKVNGKIYVGKTTKTLKERFKRHYYNHFSLNTYLYKSMRKYGFHNFDIKTLEEITEKINEKEVYWIEKLNPDYNLTKGGEGGDTSSSINYKIGIIEAHINRTKESYASYGNLGKKMKTETKSSISIKNSCSVMCEGVLYKSVKEAEKAYPGVSLRRRLDSDKYPTFYRLRKISRPRKLHI